MAASATVLHWTCNTTEQGTNREYQQKVESVLHNLLEGKHQFSESPQGAQAAINESKVYGLFQCMGDVSQYDCNICGQEASYFVKQNCPGSAGASLWSNWCFLRFEAYDFISKPEAHFVNSGLPCSKSGGKSVGSLEKLMQKVAVKAPDQENYFASESVGGSFLNLEVEIKGRAQCWKDLSKEDCGKCLWNGLKEMEQCYGGKNSKAEILSQNCVLTYGMTFLTKDSSSNNPGVWLRQRLGK
ncbi:hypothetical protein SUGI_0597910 [Cryptomeria japonica]|nr:hypothetical protein SUGI_0597910 [Cryptomeria japonica]